MYNIPIEQRPFRQNFKTIAMPGRYKEVKWEGVTIAILNKSKMLLVKRIKLPFIFKSGSWYLISGKRKKHERYLSTALREIKEETGLFPSDLKLLFNKDVMFLDKKRRVKWWNKFFIFNSRSASIKLNIEHSTYEWVNFTKLMQIREIIEIFNNSKLFTRIKYLMIKNN